MPNNNVMMLFAVAIVIIVIDVILFAIQPEYQYWTGCNSSNTFGFCDHPVQGSSAYVVSSTIFGLGLGLMIAVAALLVLAVILMARSRH